jgi:hypothetical protein
VTPADAAPEAPPTAIDGAATPPPPPTTTWSTGAPADQPAPPYAVPASPTPVVGRNVAIGIAVAALVIGGFLGALIGHVVRDTDSGGRTGFADGSNGQMGPSGGQGQMPVDPRGGGQGQGQMPMDPRGGGQGQMPMDPRGVDPDGDDWTGGGQGQLPDGVTPSTPSTPSTPTTTPATSGT